MNNINNTTKEIIEWIVCILIALVLAILIRHFIGTPTEVRMSSMYPTLKQGQRLILNRLPVTTHQIPERGDIITFEAPSNTNASSTKAEYNNEPSNIFSQFTYYVLEIGKESYIKRTIALPGEHVELKDGKVFINGEQLEENYLEDSVETFAQNEYMIDFTVPEGYIFAMGDNRTGSKDCRQFGCVPIEKIEGIVWIRFWPFDLFGEIK